MAIPTSRTSVVADIFVNENICNGCGLCVQVCSDLSLTLVNKKAAKSTTSVFGCIGCGHCMAVCPTGAITILGRTLSPADLVELPPTPGEAGFEPLLSLYQRRRSIRKFKDIPVDQEMISKIINAASTAPMGLPPSDVHLMVLDSREKNHAFAKDFCQFLEGMQWIVSGWFLTLMRPFWGKQTDEVFRHFVTPLFKTYTEAMKMDKNVVTYDAPLAIYFYGSPYSDPADPIVAATYAMLAGEALGLGTCMLGAVHPLIQKGKKAKALRAKYGIKHTSREGLFVIFGHPVPKFKKGIKRTFADVHLVS